MIDYELNAEYITMVSGDITDESAETLEEGSFSSLEETLRHISGRFGNFWDQHLSIETDSRAFIDIFYGEWGAESYGPEYVESREFYILGGAKEDMIILSKALEVALKTNSLDEALYFTRPQELNQEAKELFK